MTIIFKPNGTLDISTDGADLPEQVTDNQVVSGAFKRCKNIRLDHIGKAVQRDGSTKIEENALAHSIEFLIESGGVRYEFCGHFIYIDETLVSHGLQCATPEFDNDSGDYASPPTVTITCDTVGVDIYYTIDRTTPTEDDLKYENPIVVELYTYLKAIAIKDGFLNSEIKSAFYTETGGADLMTEGGDNIYTEGGDNLYTEG